MNIDNNNCRVCNAPSKLFSTGKILDLSVQYFECEKCGYVQTENPYWLEQAYEDVINISDTGIMSRNKSNTKIVTVTLLLLGELHGKVVDAAGGYGILVRLLRDFGVNAFWSDSYCQNMLARGFEYDKGKANLVTAFEVFEHFVEPAIELDRLLAIAPNVLFSTTIIPEPTPMPNDWWYYGTEHGQHIGFFKVKTLRKLAEERGKFLVTDGYSHHLITDKPVNTLVWKIIIRSRNIIASLVGFKMKSKIWSDHLYINDTKQGD